MPAAAKVLGSLFYEPSTRTNLSFSTAMMRLGGSVVGFSDPNATSASKGETLKDTINMVSSYADMDRHAQPARGRSQGSFNVLVCACHQCRRRRSSAPDPDTCRYDYHSAYARLWLTI